MTRHTFIVSDESPNSYGMIIRTDGIDTEDFSRNPLMYYMHDRDRGVVGRWENIRKESGRLLMDAVFDESTELGRQVRQQVEGGFLRSASIGIDQVECQRIDGVDTAVRCRLIEVSIVDIPANRNAVKLYDRRGRQVHTLAALYDDSAGLYDDSAGLHDDSAGWETFAEADTLRDAILGILGLPSTVSDMEIVKAVESLQKHQQTPRNIVSQAVDMGLIDASEQTQFLTMAQSNISAVRQLIDQRRTMQASRFPEKLKNAVLSGKIDFKYKPLFDRIAETSGYRIASELLDALPERISVVKCIEMAERKSSGSRVGWGLAEYRKYAPEELEQQPELYADLLEREGQRVPLTPETLDLYRRRYPDYLQAHPEEYRKTIKQLTTKK